jgi:hypothetical protein
LFSEFSEFDMAVDPPYLASLPTTEPKFILDPHKIDEHGRTTLKRLDLEEDATRISMCRSRGQKTSRMLRFSACSTSTPRTRQYKSLGRSLRSFPGSLEGPTKIELAGTCYSLGLRVLACCMDFLERRGEPIAEELVRVTSAQHPEGRSGHA